MGKWISYPRTLIGILGNRLWAFICSFVLCLSSCNGFLVPGQGEGTVILNLPGAPVAENRAALPSPAVLNAILYSITCTGPGDTKELKAEGGGTVTIGLAAGSWHIVVDAVYQNAPAGRGEGNVDVKAGASNTADIKMIPADDFASPVIIGEPQDTTIIRCISSSTTVSLDVKAMSFFQGALSYQWYKNTTDSNTGGTVIPGEQNSTYEAPATVLGTVFYYVEITGADNRKTFSKAVAVRVIDPDSLSIENVKTGEDGAYGIMEPFRYKVMAESGGAFYDITDQVNVGNFNYDFFTAGSSVPVTIASTSPLTGIPLASPVTVTVKSLEERLAWANTQGGSHILLLYANENMPGVSLANINNAAITLRSSNGNAGGTRTLSLNGSGRMFYISGSGAKLTLGRNVTLSGLSSNDGALVNVDSSGELVMEESSAITGNFNISGTAGPGGGVSVINGTFTMNGGTVGGSTAAKNTAAKGGGVYVGGSGNFTMNGGNIAGNEATGAGFGGGGVYVDGGNFNMGGSASISGNKIRMFPDVVNGGGVFVKSGNFIMGGSASISGNETDINGGGVYMEGGNFSMRDSASIRANSAARGGGVEIINGQFTMEGNASIRENEAQSEAGGVYVQGTFTMNGGTISGNEAKGSIGGGVRVALGTFSLNHGTVYGIDADPGLRNTAAGNGAAICKSFVGTYSGPPLSGTDGYGTSYEDNTVSVP